MPHTVSYTVPYTGSYTVPYIVRTKNRITVYGLYMFRITVRIRAFFYGYLKFKQFCSSYFQFSKLTVSKNYLVVWEIFFKRAQYIGTWNLLIQSVSYSKEVVDKFAESSRYTLRRFIPCTVTKTVSNAYSGNGVSQRFLSYVLEFGIYNDLNFRRYYQKWSCRSFVF